MKRTLLTRSLVTAITVISASVSSTAEVSVETTPGEPAKFFVNGSLDWDMVDQLIQKADTASNAVIFLNSGRGDLLAGLMLGQIIRQKKESVCGLAWLGGSQRFLER